MNELEKNLIETYGTSIIPIEEINKIIDKACRDGLIERRDYKPLRPMDASLLFEHISHLRRQFLSSEEFSKDLDEEIYEGLGTSFEFKEKDQIMDKVLKAFFEYEKIRTVKDNKKRSYFPFIAILAAIILFFSYVPEPY